MSNECDTSKSNKDLLDGNLGEAPDFPWLGVLRIPLQQKNEPLRIAATGAVLVTFKHAVVNADDVAKVSKDLLRNNGRLHMVTEAHQSWSYKLKDFTLHPEYEYATYNTIALVELNLDYEDQSDEDLLSRGDLKPICWPGKGFNTSNALYVTGFTDERLLLEKVVYKSLYVTKDICDEFYKRSSVKVDKMQEPQHYLCVFAVNNTRNCNFDNGMALVSNATGSWTWVGFGVSGPGCAAPARFLDVSYYIDWIQTSTTDPSQYDYYNHKEEPDSYT
ncbi:serine protease 30-like [Amyelois transitella]|uniref:serine protease 30-like n=1 Tax=Amyelois transitella TaxID=680683 RepID=UPI00298F92B3|nr:serine protease 30-like [Amyelois transitella]